MKKHHCQTPTLLYLRKIGKENTLTQTRSIRKHRLLANAILLIPFLLVSLILLIQKILHEDPRVQEQRAQAPRQPARIHGDVFPVQASRLSRFAPPGVLAHGAVREDAQHVGEVADTGEEEEEHGDALGALAAVVEEQLGHARSEVQDSADVAEDLAEDVEVKVVWDGAVGGRVRCAFAAVIAEPPAQDAGGADDEYGGCIEEGGAELREHGGGGGGCGLGYGTRATTLFIGDDGHGRGEVLVEAGEDSLCEGGAREASLEVADEGGRGIAVTGMVRWWLEERSSL